MKCLLMVYNPQQGQNTVIFKTNTKEIKIGQYFYGKKKKEKREVDQGSHGDAQKKKNYRSGELFGGTEAIKGIMFFSIYSRCPGTDNNADDADDADDDGGGDDDDDDDDDDDEQVKNQTSDLDEPPLAIGSF